MKTLTLGSGSLTAGRLAYGCWRLAEARAPGEPAAEISARGRAAVLAAVDAGFTLFDHADIYGRGEAETLFGRILQDVAGLRERVLVATKCGIRVAGVPTPSAPQRYDFSAAHIVRSCEASLRRLGIDTIDLYMLHRPDWLMEPAEVAGAFAELRDAGKVREFGVSNFRPSQLAALQGALPMPLAVNQVEISLARLAAFEDGTLDQCLAERITPMAWSPLGAGLLGNGARRLLPSQQGYQTGEIVAALDALSGARGVTRAAVALAWLLRHPAGIMPIVGSVEPARIREAAAADTLELTREEWYTLLEAARGERVP